MKNSSLKITSAFIFILIIISLSYWYFFVRAPSTTIETSTDSQPGGFTPFGRTPSNSGGGAGSDTNNNGDVATSTIQNNQIKIPTLRLLSDTPVGGYGASTTMVAIIDPVISSSLPSTTTTATTTKPKTPTKPVPPKMKSVTIIRWVDRGRGNIYEARGDNLDIITLSNTVVPKIYESVWNKNLTAFIASTFSDENSSVEGIYAELRARIIPKVATSTTNSSSTTQDNSITTNTPTSLTPFELKGKNLPQNLVGYAVSPKKDRVFMFTNESGVGVGYTTTFDGKSITQIFTTPLTQVSVDWPEENTIAITTKGSSVERGYLYFVDLKTGVWRKIIGPLYGLSTKVSTDAKYVFISATGNAENVVASVYNVKDKKGTDAIIRTLADKCIWGNFYKEIVYCAVPSQPIKGAYPDDWYKGTLSTVDKIWQVNATTGEIKLVSSIVDTSDRVIDAFNLGLDEKDDFLIFMNKNDLSLWSLDLVANN